MNKALLKSSFKLATKFLVLTGLFLLGALELSAQIIDNAINDPGDIAFVAYNDSGSGGKDGFSFLLLDGAPAGAKIVFTDEEWDGSAFGTGEGDITWINNTGATILGGTVVDIVNASDDSGFPITASAGIATESDSGFGTANGDQIYAFTGTRSSPGVFLAFVGSLDFATLLNTGLTAGETALVIENEGFYNGPTSFDDSAIACTSDINNSTKWTLGDYANYPTNLKDTFTGSLFAANQAPTATAPSSPTVAEDALNVALADDIQIADVDGDNQTVNFTITGGKVTLGTTGITFGGSGNGSASFTAAGTLTAINTALDAATFTPTLNLFGTNAGGIAFISSDGTANSNTASVTFDISSVNDYPTIAGLPSSITVNEDATNDKLDISEATISDIDAGSGELTVTFTATEGTFDAAAGISKTGNFTNELKLTGNLTDLNNYISLANNIYFRPNSNINGINSASVTVSINDNGNTGSGGGDDISIGTIKVNVTAVNDQPIVTAPASASISQNVTGTIAGISIADVDANSSPMLVTLTGAKGEITLNSISGITFISGDGTADVTMTFKGSLTAVNMALSDLKFIPTPDYSGAGSLAIDVSDQGATGSGGALTDEVTIPITISLKTITGITFEDNSFVFDGTAKALAIAGTLPSGTSVAYTDNSRTNVGTQEVTATISGSNYTTLILTADLTVQAPLPVSFISFAAKLNSNGSVDLTWLTALEKNNSHFIVSQSTDGITFAQLATISGSRNSNQQNRYQTTDKNPVNGTNYYQLVQFDTDGKATVLAINVINGALANTNRVSVYPNPAEDVVNVSFESGVFTTVKLIDLSGKVLRDKSINKNDTAVSFDIVNLPVASYIIKLAGNIASVSKIIIKK